MMSNIKGQKPFTEQGFNFKIQIRHAFISCEISYSLLTADLHVSD